MKQNGYSITSQLLIERSTAGLKRAIAIIKKRRAKLDKGSPAYKALTKQWNLLNNKLHGKDMSRLSRTGQGQYVPTGYYSKPY